MKAARYVALCAVTMAVPAFAQTSEKRLSADVSSTLGYSNNPFATTGSNTGAGFVQVDIRPQLRILRQNSTLTINADANVQQYFSRYTRSDNYSGGVDYSFIPAEHVQAHLNAGIDSSLVGSTNDLANRFVTVNPIGSGAATGVGTGTVGVSPISSTPITTGTDIALFGIGARRRTINGGGDVSATLSARDVVTASAFIVNSRYSQTGATSSPLNPTGDYTGYGGTIGYSRQVTANIQAGLQGSVSRYDYVTPGANTNVYSIQATTTGRINEYWTVNGALGISFVNRQVGGNQTSLSGNLSLCRRGIRVVYCLSANRAVLPTGIAGTQVSTSAGGSYSYRLTEHSNINASADYSRNSTPGGLNGTVNPVGFGIGNEYLRTTVGYDRQIRQRLRLIASANYRQIFGANLNRPSDFGGQIGVAYRLGDIR
ncbi:hypothetical protein [Sphingomonas sp. CARO-RG-8B-R24-01]|uniref:hypothetical protein n=1 Tax=Sphingomonas sp. CARO-RG-8B-R24-01 TaxID=2914831 RepID=UPI001F58D159